MQFSILIKIYGKSKQLSKAIGVLDEMKALGVTPGIVVYTCVIQSCIKAQQILIALKKFDEMKKRRIQGDAVTYQTLLRGCMQFKKYEQALAVLEDAVAAGVAVPSDVIEAVVAGASQLDGAETRIAGVREQLKKHWFANPHKQHTGRKYNKHGDDRSQQNSYNQKRQYKGGLESNM